jgi:hypothetical protein
MDLELLHRHMAPWPGVPGTGFSQPFGQPGNEIYGGGIQNYFRGLLPETSGVTGIGTGFGRPQFGPRFPWQHGGDDRRSVQDLFRAPTAEEIIQQALNNTVGRQVPGSFPVLKLGTVPQTPIPPVTPRIDFRPPAIPNFVPAARPGGPPTRQEPLVASSWVRWNWTAGIAVLCLVGGLLYGYFGRRRVGI